MNQRKGNDHTASIAVLTVSDTRTASTDRSGQSICQLLELHGFPMRSIQRCKDDIVAIRSMITPLLQRTDIDAIIVSGGSGISSRDVTIEAIQPFFDKEIVGFGEIFRYLSFTEQVGSRAMLSRATAGIARGKLIFLLPGSPAAVHLAMTRLIIPELDHLLLERNK